MIEILGCLLAVAAVAWATAAAGRLVGITLTAVASGLLAFLMPPVFSLRVESGAGIAALVVNSLAGLVVAHKFRPRRPPRGVTDLVRWGPARPPAAEGPALAEAISQVVASDACLRQRASDVGVHVDESSRPPLSADDLDRVLLDILRTAFSQSKVHRVDVYSSRRPGEECIRVAAEYAVSPAPARLRITGRTGDSCVALTSPHWSNACSANWFDNGFEFIYQVRIEHPRPPL